MLKNTIFYFLCLVCITTTIIACSSGGDGSSNNNPVNETVYKYESCSSDSEQPLIYFNKSEFDAANGNPSSGTTLNWGTDDECYEFKSSISQNSTTVEPVSSIININGCSCTAVSNLVVEVNIQGEDADHPNGDGSGVGTDMSSHPDIDMISFTGSTRAGRLISKNSAETIKRVCLELGGKGGNIVFADSYKNAVRDGIRNVMSNSGQSCDAPTRMLVEKSIYERAVNDAVDEANKIQVDQASKKGDHIGPVISKTQYDKIISLIESGISEGATLAAGGPELPNGLDKGYFIKPTIFTNVTNEMRIAKEEIFGPVLSIIPFDKEDEAINIVNDTSYGLGNYLQTEDKVKAHRVAQKLRSGCVYINGNAADAGTPFGGYRQSGNGREGGVWGLEEYLEVKTVTGWK